MVGNKLGRYIPPDATPQLPATIMLHRLARIVRRAFVAAPLLSILGAPFRATAAQTITDKQRADVNRLIDVALRDTVAYDRLSIMTDRFGNRISGSKSLEDAIDWILAQMKTDGLANVRGEPVMVPHWVRGAESATLVSPRAAPLHMLGLGMSVGTPAGGITAPVLVVGSFEELQRRAGEAKGKIVVFDHPFPSDKPGLDGYREAIVYRGGCAGRSGEGRCRRRADPVDRVVLDSESAYRLDALRHDGREDSRGGVEHRRRGDAASDAESRRKGRGDAHDERADVARRAVAQRRRRASRQLERPDEVVVLGGHIDSWDVGEGAMDDGGCSVAAWEAVRLMKELGLQPKRTVRVVLWTNEENGGRGGRGYRDAHEAELSKHSVAMECDNGVFKPIRRSLSGHRRRAGVRRSRSARCSTASARRASIAGDGEADVGPILQRGVPGLALDVDDTKYFWYHHSWGDMMTVIDRDDFAKCIATMAVMAYVLADLDQPGAAMRVL